MSTESPPKDEITPEGTVNRTAPAKRRGRRPAGQETRTALIEAARAEFAESGYEGATVRSIAARAGVDAAMVNHWFGGKEGLFGRAILELPFDPASIVETALDGPLESLGERITRNFLTQWDGAGGQVFTALVRSLTASDDALAALRELVVRRILNRITEAIGSDRPQLRASLCGTQMIGLGLARYVVGVEPVASEKIDMLVSSVAPTLQRYLTGDID